MVGCWISVSIAQSPIGPASTDICSAGLCKHSNPILLRFLCTSFYFSIASTMSAFSAYSGALLGNDALLSVADLVAVLVLPLMSLQSIFCFGSSLTKKREPASYDSGWALVAQQNSSTTCHRAYSLSCSCRPSPFSVSDR